MKYAVLGAGNGGQAISAWLSMQGHEVFLYEIVEEMAFKDLIGKIKDELKEYEKEEEKEELNNKIDENTLLNKEQIIKGIKKYIVRY